MPSTRERVNQIVDGVLLSSGVAAGLFGDALLATDNGYLKGVAIAAGGIAMAVTGLAHIDKLIEPQLAQEMPAGASCSTQAKQATAASQR